MKHILIDGLGSITIDESKVFHLDRCDFLPKKERKMDRTDEGYLQGNAAIARTGVLTYILSDGTIRKELVPRETLFNVDSMRSLALKPITNSHPPETLIDSKTVKRRKVGTVGETIQQDGDFLTASMVITDADAIESVEAGKDELSPGYRADILVQEGTWNGERYDAIQIKRTYNHLAICDKARGGQDLKLNLDETKIDSVEGFGFRKNTITNIPYQKKGRNMPTIRLDGIDYEAAQEVINNTTKLLSKIDELEDAVKKGNVDLQKLTAAKDQLQEKCDELEKRDIASEIVQGVSNRLSLLRTAEAVIDEKEQEKLDNLSDTEIKKMVIVTKYPNAKLDDKEDVYITARFDAIVEELDFDPNAVKDQVKKVKKVDSPSIDKVEKARLDGEEYIKNAYMSLGKSK